MKETEQLELVEVESAVDCCSLGNQTESRSRWNFSSTTVRLFHFRMHIISKTTLILKGIHFKMIICDEFTYFTAFNHKDYNKNNLISELPSQTGGLTLDPTRNA